MAKKYYVDTSIWRDLYENRSDRFRPLGDWAFEMFSAIKESSNVVLYSDLIVNELGRFFSKEEVWSIFSIIDSEGLLIKAEISGNQKKEASIMSRLLKIHFADCLHAIIARDNDAVLVTRDKHFEGMHGIVEIKKPEELI